MNEIVKDNLYLSFPDPTNGIFTHLAAKAELPWTDTEVDNSLLDLDYLTQYGQRARGAIVDLMTDFGAKQLTDAQIDQLAMIVWQRFGKNWQHLWDINQIEYDPKINYDMTEEETVTRSGEHAESGKSSEQQSGNTSRKVDNANSVYGFNSDVAVPSDTGSGTESTDSGLNTSGTQDTGGTHSETETRSKTTQGDASVRPIQYVINEDRATWAYDMFDQIFKQLNTVLTAPVYITM